MFNLETALSTWRHYFAQRRGFQKEDLDELERHVRDHVRHAVEQDISEEEAFWEAVREVGDCDGAEEEYRKVYWGKVKRLGRLANELSWRTSMFRSYLKTALRHLLRQKGYALINIAGLAVGLAVCLVIGAYVRHELSYDRFHPDVDRVYRIIQEGSPEDKLMQGRPLASLHPGVAWHLESRLPEFQHVTEVSRPARRLFAQDEKQFYIDGVIAADSAFLKVFPFPLVAGNPETVLSAPHQMVVTRSLARELFGDRDPMGQVLRYENEAEYMVAGVIEDVPTNAHFRFDALLSLDEEQRAARYSASPEWYFFGNFVYVRLADSVDPALLQARLRAIEKDLGRESEPRFMLQPLTSIHLSQLSNEIAGQGNPTYLYLFSAIGVIILLIACINYMNLSTARFSSRAREVGIRKVVGAHRAQLVGQFLSESLLLVLTAVPLAILLTALSMPYVNKIIEHELRLAPVTNGTGIVGVIVFVLLTGIFAGLYPAFLLSRFRPVLVLKGEVSGAGSGTLLRKGLVIFQFSASIILLVGTLVVHQQLGYMQHRDLGFDEAHLVRFNSDALGERFDEFKQALSRYPGIQAVTSGTPIGITYRNWVKQITDEKTGETVFLNSLNVGYDYAETVGLKLVAGRFFSPEMGADSVQSVVLNEAAVRYLGLGRDPVGQSIKLDVAGEPVMTVIGVVKDFHNETLRQEIQPYFLTLAPGNNWTGLARLAPGDLKVGIAALERTWKEFVPDRPFSFTFLEQDIEALYRSEVKLGKLFGIFAGIAILVACLGLFGLAAFTTERRTKEIGIRKVLGASASSIVTLLSKDFLKLVLIAFVLAAPLAYLAMSRWLEDFAYRIELGPGIFLIAGGLALLLALATVSYQAVKAALADPVTSLRYE